MQEVESTGGTVLAGQLMHWPFPALAVPAEHFEQLPSDVIP